MQREQDVTSVGRIVVLVVAAFAMALALYSCSLQRSETHDSHSIGGLEGLHKAAAYGQVGRRIVFICITDLPETQLAELRVGASESGGATFVVGFMRSSGTMTEVKCVTHHAEHQGVVTVQGRQMDLSHGRVIVISMANEPVVAKQFDVELPSGDDVAKLKQMLRENPEVSQFIDQ